MIAWNEIGKGKYHFHLSNPVWKNPFHIMSTSLTGRTKKNHGKSLRNVLHSLWGRTFFHDFLASPAFCLSALNDAVYLLCIIEGDVLCWPPKVLPKNYSGHKNKGRDVRVWDVTSFDAKQSSRIAGMITGWNYYVSRAMLKQILWLYFLRGIMWETQVGCETTMRHSFKTWMVCDRWPTLQKKVFDGTKWME